MDEPVADLLRRCRSVMDHRRSQAEDDLIDEIDAALALHSARRIAAHRLFQRAAEPHALPFIRSRR